MMLPAELHPDGQAEAVNHAPRWRHPALCDPWQFAAEAGEGVVMAVLTGTEGPAYRNLGAAMAIAPDGRNLGRQQIGQFGLSRSAPHPSDPLSKWNAKDQL